MRNYFFHVSLQFFHYLFPEQSRATVIVYILSRKTPRCYRHMLFCSGIGTYEKRYMPNRSSPIVSLFLAVGQEIGIQTHCRRHIEEFPAVAAPSGKDTTGNGNLPFSVPFRKRLTQISHQKATNILDQDNCCDHHNGNYGRNVP